MACRIRGDRLVLRGDRAVVGDGIVAAVEFVVVAAFLADGISCGCVGSGRSQYRTPAWTVLKKTLIADGSTSAAALGRVEDVGRQSKVISAVVTGLVVVLAALAFVIVRGTSQPERPDLSPVNVTPTATVSEGTGGQDGTGSAQGSGGGAGDSGAGDGQKTPGSGSEGDASAKGQGELQHSYEPAPNPPREVPSDDDGDDDDEGAGGDDDDGAGGDDDDD